MTENRKKLTNQAMLTANTSAVTDAVPYIHGISGEYAGYDIPVRPTGILLGRDPASCHLIFTRTPGISRFHARVTYNRNTGYFVVTDLNSTNGVYTEEHERLEPGGKLVLAPGQIFRLCGDLAVFRTSVESL